MGPGEMAQEDSSDTFKAAVIYPRVFTDLLRCWNSGLKKKKIHRAHLEDELRYFSKGWWCSGGEKRIFYLNEYSLL